jgi:hypothetical protein
LLKDTIIKHLGYYKRLSVCDRSALILLLKNITDLRFREKLMATARKPSTSKYPLAMATDCPQGSGGHAVISAQVFGTVYPFVIVPRVHDIPG